MRILAIGAHSDDADFFCGGTLALYAAAGYTVGICCLADGRRGGKAATPEQLAKTRHAEFLASASILSAEGFWLGIPDGEVMADLETRHKVMDLMRSFRPDLIITHPPDDYHPDHTAAGHLAVEASFAAGIGVPPVLFTDSESGLGFVPEEYVDVTAVWVQKVQMLNAHHSQYSGWVDPATGEPGNWLVDRAAVLGQFRGLQCQVRYAEAFRWFRAHGRLRTTRLLP